MPEEVKMAPAPSCWVDRRALDRNGELLGVVVDAYTDPVTRHVAWLAVSTGYFGRLIAVVPVHGASLLGDDVVVPHDRATIATAPAVDVLVAVDPSQERALIDHYTRTASATPAEHKERGT